MIVLGVRHGDMSILSKAMLAGGWVLFIGSLTTAFATQAKLNAYLLKPNLEPDLNPPVTAHSGFSSQVSRYPPPVFFYSVTDYSKNSAIAFVHLFWECRISSTTSRIAPPPPGL